MSTAKHLLRLFLYAHILMSHRLDAGVRSAHLNLGLCTVDVSSSSYDVVCAGEPVSDEGP
jgi:hypothetical protein